MTTQERVPRADAAAVKKQNQLWFGTLQVAMKRHSQMTFDTVDYIKEILCLETGRNKPIKSFQQDQRAAGSAVEQGKIMFGAYGGPLEKVPAIIGRVRQHVEIPAKALDRSTNRSAGNRETSGLGERRGLQAKAEPPQIARCSLIERITVAKPHGRVKVIGRHSAAIVEYGQGTIIPGPVEGYGNRFGPGRYAVVDNIGYRG
jgi:hypothetical protein